MFIGEASIATINLDVGINELRPADPHAQGAEPATTHGIVQTFAQTAADVCLSTISTRGVLGEQATSILDDISSDSTDAS